MGAVRGRAAKLVGETTNRFFVIGGHAQKQFHLAVGWQLVVDLGQLVELVLSVEDRASNALFDRKVKVTLHLLRVSIHNLVDICLAVVGEAKLVAEAVHDHVDLALRGAVEAAAQRRE